MKMSVLDVVLEPLRFVQQTQEYSRRVRQAIGLVQLVVDAWLSQDRQRMRIVHGEISRSAEELVQLKLSLYDQIKDMRFRSPGGYAFSQYLACQGRIVESSRDLADLLVLRQITVPADLHADFRALAAQVIDVCERAMTPAEVVSSEAETAPAEADVEKAVEALEGIANSRRQAGQLGLKLVLRIDDLQEQLGPATATFLDRCCAALQRLADAAEHVGDHLRLIYPQE
jgi:uncharacterized protein Yka (UPF0111/DUF47 family)